MIPIALAFFVFMLSMGIALLLRQQRAGDGLSRRFHSASLADLDRREVSGRDFRPHTFYRRAPG